MGKTNAMRKIAAGVFCVLLACSMLPAIAFAGGGGVTAGVISNATVSSQDDADSATTNREALETQASGNLNLTFSRARSSSLTLKIGSIYTLGTKASSGATITYISTVPKRVAVTKTGKLRALTTGTAVVLATAKSNGVTEKRKLRVRVVSAGNYKAVKSITAKVNKKTVLVGRTAEITTTFTPENASNKNLLYKSMTPRVATVTADGKVTAKVPGTAKVRVTSAANSKATYTLTFKITAKEVVPKLKNYSWAQLKDISAEIAAAKNDAEGLEIAKKYGLVNAKGKLTGAVKSIKLTDGTKSTVRILGFRQDKLASGGLAGISFEFADIPTTHGMNADGSNTGGWALSDMRSWLNSDFYKSLPADLRKCIAPAKKRTNNVGQVDEENDKSVVSTTKDKLWLLSMSEVYGKLSGQSNRPWSPATYDAEGSQYKLYSDKKVTTSNYSFCGKLGANSWWWLRSPCAFFSVDFHRVYLRGDWDDYYYADLSFGVSPGFCF